MTGACVEQPKPREYGSAGDDWNLSGWLVPVEWRMLTQPLSPRTHISQIRPLLPTQYTPLDKNDNGTENCYLASISDSLGALLLQLMSSEDVLRVAQVAAELRDDREGEAEEEEIRSAPITETQKKQLINARRSQGKYRLNVEAVEHRCRLTRGFAQEFLGRQSHQAVGEVKQRGKT